MQRWRNQRGAALVEAAMVVPILLLISAGIFEFGRAYQTWQVLTNAAREGARVAVLPNGAPATAATRVRQYMQDGQLPDFATATVSVDRAVAITVNGAPQTASRSRHRLPVRLHRAAAAGAARGAGLDDREFVDHAGKRPDEKRGAVGAPVGSGVEQRRVERAVE